MIVKPADELHELVTKILSTAGADKRNAHAVAEHLVLANLSGVDTHGVWQLPGYVEAIRDEYLLPTAWPVIVRDTTNTAIVSGNWTFGQTAARYATQVAIEKAKSQNVAVVALVESHHIGRLGHYPEMAAAEGLISMVWAGGFSEEAPVVAPFGGRKPLLHTNPIAMGFPAGDEPPMVFDFATSALSGVKVVNAHRRNEKLPPGCIVDNEGNPSTNPGDFFEGGAQVPFGTHKGYALMMAAEFLGRIFCASDDLADPARGGPILRHQGTSLIVFKADLFQQFADYARRADEFQQRTRAIPPAPGFQDVLVPGDPEVRTRAARKREGIPIHDDVWRSIREAAASVGIKDI